jgi:hypothetical protein
MYNIIKKCSGNALIIVVRLWELHTLPPPTWYVRRALFALPRSLFACIRVLMAGEKKPLICGFGNREFGEETGTDWDLRSALRLSDGALSSCSQVEQKCIDGTK